MSNEGREPLYLSTRYNPEFKEVVIEANAAGWDMLLELITWLRDGKEEYNHYHIDKSSGIEGNIRDLIIEYREAGSGTRIEPT